MLKINQNLRLPDLSHFEVLIADARIVLLHTSDGNVAFAIIEASCAGWGQVA